MLIIINIILLLLFTSPAFASEAYTLEKIVVRAQGLAQQTITAPDINQKEPVSLADLLNYVSGIDLRNRGTSGIQADLSLRGSTYEQVGVFIDGLNFTDPQTGHYNLDIPLTIFDLERIDVLKESGFSLSGQGGFAGSVNFVTKKPTKKALNLETVFGEHALFGEAMSFSLPGKDLSSRVSLDHEISKAARPNTDFEYKTASLYLNRDFEETQIDTLCGYQKKDFGADSFYSNLFPEEEEHTETFFIRAGHNSKLDSASLKDNLFFREHRDKFILTRNNPASVNYHKTYLYGLSSQLSLPLKWADLLLGMDTARDEISSTNLGKHSGHYEAGSFGCLWRLQDRLNCDLNVRIGYYQNWSWQESYNFGLSYNCLDDKLKIKGSLGHAFRVPSYTELYYSDAANKGNANLTIENTDSFSLGLDFRGRELFFSLDGFLRHANDLIDWTRFSPIDPWSATNLGRVDFKGIEFQARFKPDLIFKGSKLEMATFSYNYMYADKKAANFFSKYALDILKHQVMLGIYSNILGLNCNWQLAYNQRYYGETYFVGNLYIAKKIKIDDFLLEPFIKIDNFNNAKYSEVGGVIQPGRWIKSGFKFEW